MDKEEIFEFLNECGIEDIEDLSYNKDFIVAKFNYKFDLIEFQGATEYAKEECEDSAESDCWYDNYFLPYLKNFAEDNVADILMDCEDEFEINCKYICKELTKDNYKSLDFIIVLSDMDKIDIENIIKSI